MEAASLLKPGYKRAVMDFDVAGRDHVITIDYHTGLGPYSFGELPSGLSGYERSEYLGP